MKVRLEQLMNLKRKEREHEIFIWSAEQHAEQLSDVQQKCQVSVALQMLDGGEEWGGWSMLWKGGLTVMTTIFDT